MRIRTAALLATAGLLLTGTSAADTTQQNLAKYHALRARLVKDFVVVGSGPGMSEPADVRHEGQGFIKWADQTIRLGWYLGVLASELHLAAHPSEFPGAKGAEDTVNELYSALLAMERLDAKAESAFPECGGVDALDGFFLRDDVPAGFHSHFPPLTTTFSDFVDPALTNKEESQDQVYHVLLGLALVKHLVPATVTKNGKVLRDWAVEQARRIVERMAGTDWTIRNPACGNRKVARGEDARLFSGGTSLAIGFITDGAYVPNANAVLGGLWSSVPQGVGSTDIDNVHMASALAAVGNGWGAQTADDLYQLSIAPGWPLYPTLHRVLHTAEAAAWCTTTGTPTNASARKMLDELPAGADIASPRPGTASHQFTRSHRFLRGTAEAYTGEVGSDGQRYPGLDYMLLHNLYAIATPSTWEGGALFGAGLCATASVADAGTGTSGGPDGGSLGSSSSSSSSSSSGGNDAAPGGTSDGGCGCGIAKPNVRGLAFGVVLAAALALRRRRRA
jgi:hypothetical protein